MNTDDLIDVLAHDATPVRPLSVPWVRTVVWLSISVAYVSALIVLMSPDVTRITGIRAPRFWLEQCAAFSTAIAAAVAALASVIPGWSRRMWLLPVAPLALWIAVLAWGCVRDWMAHSSAGLAVGSDWPCVMAMVLGALLPFAAMTFMLRRGAPLTPRATAAYAALAGGALSSVVACLSRPSPHPTTMTVVAWHLGTLLTLIAVGAWTGRTILDWRLNQTLATANDDASLRR